MLELIMNMPVRSSNALIHRIIISHPATSLEELRHELAQNDLLIVEEWYPNDVTKVFENKGPVALNYKYIGKIKVWSKQ
jgi:hypothetical protein